MNRGRRTTRKSAGCDAASEEACCRARLIEAAGERIAEVGFDRALCRDIAKIAGINAAAVNYHFGGRDRLYAAVLREAGQKCITAEQVRAIRERGGSPAQTLRALVSHSVRTVAEGHGWHLQVVVREIASPTPALEELYAETLAPKFDEVLEVIGSVMGLPTAHPAVRRGMVSFSGQIGFLFHNRYLLEKLLPGVFEDPSELAALEEQIYEFTLAGLRAVARTARKDTATSSRPNAGAKARAGLK